MWRGIRRRRSIRQDSRSLEEYHLQVREIVNAIDPMGLIEIGTPDDEYDPEVRDLVQLRGMITGEAVREIFDRWFWEGSVDADACHKIAAGIRSIA